jgi:hypothetical protein
MTFLFVDTNVLLHYRRLEEIDWFSLSKSKEAVISPNRPTLGRG